MAGGDAAGDGEAGIIGEAGAEEDLEAGIVLQEEGFEVCFEVGLGAVQRLEQAYGRGEVRGGTGGFVAQEAEQPDEGQERGSCGGDQTEEAEVEEDSEHVGGGEHCIQDYRTRSGMNVSGVCGSKVQQELTMRKGETGRA